MARKNESPAVQAPPEPGDEYPEKVRILAEGRLVSDRLWNADLAPARQRNWRVRSLFALWMCDVHSIAGYTFAAGLFITGLVGWQVFLALVLGITLVYFLMNFAGTAGQKTGVPYPVLARMSFGLFGANLAALIRALIAIAWYGIQTWLASEAVLVLLFSVWPQLTSLDGPDVPRILGLTPLGWAAFLVLWAVQLLVIRRGMETVRKFQDWAGPAIWVAMFALAIYILTQAGNKFSLSIPGVAPLDGPAALTQFFSAIALTVTYFAALLLNFCDFSRFAPDRKTILRGNFWACP
ncbi:probable allantoin permease [Arthrobacter sp. Hiyo8]|nr:probable allantoin permease [Arthrobacter sp. Hiyo8]